MKIVDIAIALLHEHDMNLEMAKEDVTKVANRLQEVPATREELISEMENIHSGWQNYHFRQVKDLFTNATG